MSTSSYHRIVAPLREAWQGPSVFLAGGITGCPEWQDEAAEIILSYANVLDPRRKPWPKEGDMLEQVQWEYEHLRKATAVLFWFPSSSICPIALLELGAMWERKPWGISVGCEPGYPRAADIFAQAKAFEYKGRIYKDIQELAKAAVRYLGR